MSKKDLTNEIASVHLGKKSIGSEFYDPNLLVKIPRQLNRLQYNIQNDNLPFLGCDVWHNYEFSAMTNNNLPISKILKLKYSAKSEFLVESKSLKLYLNSFNMSNFGNNTKECLEICKNIIEKDLSNALNTKVEANFIENERINIFQKFQNIMDFIDENSLKIEEFSENPNLLKIEFDALRSNCRVTHQPDFGDIFIYYKSKKHILENSLVQYLCSFRKEYHFHEECCEMIYKRLFDILNKDDELFICTLYTRRGGIDINPIRYSANCSIKDYEDLIDTKKFARCPNKQ